MKKSENQGGVVRETYRDLALLTPHQVAELLQVHTDWVYDNAAAGNLPHIRLGRNIRFKPADLDAYLSGEWQPRGE